MTFNAIARLTAAIPKRVPLRAVLIVPFVAQIVGAVGLVGYLSFDNGQKAVSTLANRLLSESSDRIEEHLEYYLAEPHHIANHLIELITLNFVKPSNLEAIEHFSWHSLQESAVSYIHYALETGEYLGLGYLDRQDFKDKRIVISKVLPSTAEQRDFTRDDRGHLIELASSSYPRNPHREVWYREAMGAKQPLWSHVYHSYNSGEGMLSLAALHPLQDRTGKPIGAIAVSIILSSLDEFLEGLALKSTYKIFIVDRNGILIASSNREKHALDRDIGQLRAINSKDPLLQAATQSLLAKTGNFGEIETDRSLRFNFQGKWQLLRVRPWKDRYGLDWLIMTVVPESIFTAQIEKNTNHTVTLCLMAAAIAMLFGLLTSRWIVRPIEHLNVAAKELAEGRWDAKVSINRSDEVGELTRSFNRMAEELHDSFLTLEQRVSERTHQLAEAKEKAEVANQAKSSFLANMSHELRTPLNAIIGFTQLLARSSNFTPEQRDQIAIVHHSGEHLLALINQVLDLSKIEAGRTTLNEVSFDLYELLDTLEDLFRLKAAEKKLQLIFDRDPELPRYLRTDSLKLRQILINLLNNALKFTEQGGVSLMASAISSEHETETTQVYFAVRDTGPGIAPEEMEQLFEAFGQTATGRQAQEGTGLGLPIARKFVQVLGGEMAVTSNGYRFVPGEGVRREEREMKGATFEFAIAATVADAREIQSAPVQRRVIALEPNQQRYRILIVDDKPLNRRLLIELLAPFGFELREAGNGREAIDVWEAWLPHLIFMDMRMPVMNGYEATQAIKATTKGSATAIIALTASVLEEERAVTISAGCDDFLHKPFREQEIWLAMNKHIGVRYLYDDSATDAGLTSEVNASLLSADALASLPTDWTDDLEYALLAGDSDLFPPLIERLASLNPSLIRAIAHCLDNFEYDKLLNLIRACRNQSA